MKLEIDFRKFVRVAHDGGLPLVPLDGSGGDWRRCEFSDELAVWVVWSCYRRGWATTSSTWSWSSSRRWWLAARREADGNPAHVKKSWSCAVEGRSFARRSTATWPSGAVVHRLWAKGSSTCWGNDRSNGARVERMRDSRGVFELSDDIWRRF